MGRTQSVGLKRKLMVRPIRSRRLELGVIGGHSVEGESRAVNWGTEPEAFTLRVGRETTS